MNIRRSRGLFTVHLQSRGNPDYAQHPDLDLPGVPDVHAHVQTIEEAALLCRAYIEYYDLGGGNWTGGQIVRAADGLVMGRVAYNGRIFPDESLPSLPSLP